MNSHKWKHFPNYWAFVRGIHRPPVDSPHKGQWWRALTFSLMYVWTNDWVSTGIVPVIWDAVMFMWCHCDDLMATAQSMMTSSNGNIFRVTALCVGNSPVSGEFPTQRSVMWNFDVFFDLRLNERLSKQSWGWWFETSSCSLWRHCNASQGVSVVSILENMIVDALAKPRDIENLGGFSPLNSIYWGSVTVALQMISDKISVWSVSRYVDSVGYIEQGDY